MIKTKIGQEATKKDMNTKTMVMTNKGRLEKDRKDRKTKMEKSSSPTPEQFGRQHMGKGNDESTNEAMASKVTLVFEQVKQIKYLPLEVFTLSKLLMHLILLQDLKKTQCLHFLKVKNESKKCFAV